MSHEHHSKSYSVLGALLENATGGDKLAKGMIDAFVGGATMVAGIDAAKSGLEGMGHGIQKDIGPRSV